MASKKDLAKALDVYLRRKNVANVRAARLPAQFVLDELKSCQEQLKAAVLGKKALAELRTRMKGLQEDVRGVYKALRAKEGPLARRLPPETVGL